MDVNKFSALLTIVQCGSFSKAAIKLNYTQAGLTQMMNSFEKSLGFTVLNRGYTGVSLNENGKRILPKVKKVLNAYAELNNEISMICNTSKEIIKIGAYSSMAAHWLPSILESFKKEYPNISIEIQMGGVEALYDGIHNGNLDMAFCSKTDKYHCKWTSLKPDNLVAVLPKDFDVKTNGFPVNNFTGTHFFMPSLGFDIDISDVLNASGAKPDIQTTFVEDATIISFVEHGLGVSMLSELILQGRKDSVKILPLIPKASRSLGIAVDENKTITPAMKSLIHYAVSFCKKIS